MGNPSRIFRFLNSCSLSRSSDCTPHFGKLVLHRAGGDAEEHRYDDPNDKSEGATQESRWAIKEGSTTVRGSVIQWCVGLFLCTLTVFTLQLFVCG